MVKVLILGSKEYPFGVNGGDDPIPSGGMETYVDDLAPALSRLCELTIVTRRFRGTARRESSDGIRIVRVPWLRGKWLRNPTFNFISFLASTKLMKDADIVYSNGIVAGLAGLLLGRFFGKKAVYRPAGTAFLQQRFPLRQLLMCIEKSVMKKSDAVVFHSEGEMENARKNMGLRLGNGHVILTGFRVGKFANAPEERKASNGVVIASVSRFVPVKGLDVLLKACALMDSEFSLLMVGSGPEEGRLRRIAKERGISGSVRFLGFRHDVPQILRRSDVFVVSSFSEGLPTSLLEAMAAGCACVVTDIGLPIGHMKTGVVVRPGSPEEMGKALDFLAGSSPLRRKLGENAREFVLGNCTQEMAAGKHERLFRELLRRGKRS